MKIIWKDVPGYENVYQISNFGSVRSLDRKYINSNGRKFTFNGKILKLNLKNNGYLSLELNHKSVVKYFSVHRLVAITFIDNKDNKPCVNHIDGDKTNNFVENLEWVTHSENTRHAHKNDLINICRGERHYLTSITENDVREIRKMISNGIKHTEIAHKFNVDDSTISNIKRNKTWGWLK